MDEMPGSDIADMMKVYVSGKQGKVFQERNDVPKGVPRHHRRIKSAAFMTPLMKAGLKALAPMSGAQGQSISRCPSQPLPMGDTDMVAGGVPARPATADFAGDRVVHPTAEVLKQWTECMGTSDLPSELSTLMWYVAQQDAKAREATLQGLQALGATALQREGGEDEIESPRENVS